MREEATYVAPEVVADGLFARCGDLVIAGVEGAGDEDGKFMLLDCKGCVGWGGDEDACGLGALDTHEEVREVVCVDE